MLACGQTKKYLVLQRYFSIIIAWQYLGDRNITFADELEFEISELAFIYK